MTTKTKTKTTRRVTTKAKVGARRKSLNARSGANQHQKDAIYTDVHMGSGGTALAHRDTPSPHRTDWVFDAIDANAFSPTWEFTVAFNPVHKLTTLQMSRIVQEANSLVDDCQNARGVPVVVNVPAMERAANLSDEQGMILGSMLLHLMDWLNRFKQAGLLEHMRIGLGEWRED